MKKSSISQDACWLFSSVRVRRSSIETKEIEGKRNFSRTHHWKEKVSIIFLINRGGAKGEKMNAWIHRRRQIKLIHLTFNHQERENKRNNKYERSTQIDSFRFFPLFGCSFDRIQVWQLSQKWKWIRRSVLSLSLSSFTSVRRLISDGRNSQDLSNVIEKKLNHRLFIPLSDRLSWMIEETAGLYMRRERGRETQMGKRERENCSRK